MSENKSIKMYTVREVMNLLKCSRPSVYNYLRSGELKAVKIGSCWKISEKNLQDFTKNGLRAGYFKDYKGQNRNSAKTEK